MTGSAGRRLGGCVLVVLFASALGLPSLDGYFLSDDFGYLKLFHDKPLSAFVQLGDTSEGIWGRPLDEWRPLFGLSWRLDAALWGMRDWGYHLTNVLLHGLAAALVFLLAAEVPGAGHGAALLAGLLFAAAPVHAEAICWVTGRTDSLPAVFYLAAFLLYARFRRSGSRRAYAAALGGMALGLLVKEVLLTLPVMLGIYELALRAADGGENRRRSLKALVPFFAVAVVFVLLRRLAVGSLAREELLSAETARRFLGDQALFAIHILTPFGGLIRTTGPTARDLLLAGAVLTMILVCTALLVRWGTREAKTSAAFFGIAWYAVSILPLVVTYRTPRHLYLPSAGIAVSLALLLLPRGRRTHPARFAAAAALTGLYAVTLLLCSREWEAAGGTSRTAQREMARALAETAPADLTVVRGLPPRVPGGFGFVRLWEYALPFALQPPFAPRDLYGETTMLEDPRIYCCPPQTWWHLKRPRLAALTARSADPPLRAAALTWDAGAGRLAVSRRELTRGTLAGEIDAASSGRRRARRLVAALGRAVAGSSAPEVDVGERPEDLDEF